ncbi:MAG: leucine--tRNA ligase [Thermoplasmata archaeon]
MEEDYDPLRIEEKWQEKWRVSKAFRSRITRTKTPFYCLEMYPYPSATLHIGHLRNYVIGDCLARFKRMQGYNVLYPMGYDAFGLPAENAAISHGVDPEKWTRDNIKSIKRQQERIGLSYDWERQIQSCDEDYYKWSQWMFLKFYEKGWAYRERAYVNWCPKCDTVLANEQVIGDRCWRCDSQVDSKNLEQWFFRIRSFADELLSALDVLDWPERVKSMQRNWIGRSEGTTIRFRIQASSDFIPVFTTRPDTVFGVTFLVFAPEHPKIQTWAMNTEYEESFRSFRKETRQERQDREPSAEREKRGMFIGKYAIHPFTEEELPIYVGNFVVHEYGGGVVMAVPAHDQRDFDFAKKHNLPVRIVIQPHEYTIDAGKMNRAYVGDGHLVNSQEFSGLDNREAIGELNRKLKELGLGGHSAEYKLRDWLISRQRYWGTPIPIVYCKSCGIVPVPYDQLPVRLPRDVKFAGPGNPIASSETFVNVKCPKCNAPARRETDTMDTFVDSSWYFLRYINPHDVEAPFRKADVGYWMPVNQYIGGIEHAVMHLIYARYFTKALRDLGLLAFDEPFSRLLCQGMVTKKTPYCPLCETYIPPEKVENTNCAICGQTTTMRSAKMSKRLGNVVNPEDLISRYGADTARFLILLAANPESELEWSGTGVGSVFKFLRTVFSIMRREIEFREDARAIDRHMVYRMNKTMMEVTKNLEALRMKDAVTSIRSLVDDFMAYGQASVDEGIYRAVKETVLLLLSPVTPHLCEELWEEMGHDSLISLEKWPSFDDIPQSEEYGWSLLSDVCDDIQEILDITKMDTPIEIAIAVASKWKYRLLEVTREEFEQEHSQQGVMKKIMETDLRRYQKEIGGMIHKYLEIGLSTHPGLSQEDEYSILRDLAELIEVRFGCRVNVTREEETEVSGAKYAFPSRPAIMIS